MAGACAQVAGEKAAGLTIQAKAENKITVLAGSGQWRAKRRKQIEIATRGRTRPSTCVPYRASYFCARLWPRHRCEGARAWPSSR
jgi:hypothetical protein